VEEAWNLSESDIGKRKIERQQFDRRIEKTTQEKKSGGIVRSKGTMAPIGRSGFGDRRFARLIK
jgi:hypothetical protein